VKREGHADADCRVGVVAAEVGDIRVLGAVGNPLLILCGKGIDVSPVPYVSSRAGAVDVYVESGSGDRPVNVEPIGFKGLTNKAGGFVLVHAHLRVHVEVTTDCYEQLSERLFAVCRIGEGGGKMISVGWGNAGYHLQKWAHSTRPSLTE
jgi:hypothetical protein